MLTWEEDARRDDVHLCIGSIACIGSDTFEQKGKEIASVLSVARYVCVILELFFWPKGAANEC